MQKSKFKLSVDIWSMILLAGAVITGFMLHNDVWHLHVYNDTLLWGLHEGLGLGMLALGFAHCVQHSFWFKNYAKLKLQRKRVTTILLVLGVIVTVSGVVLMCGSHSEFVSRLHYVCSILFTLLAIGHVVKRWKLLKSLIP